MGENKNYLFSPMRLYTDDLLKKINNKNKNIKVTLN